MCACGRGYNNIYDITLSHRLTPDIIWKTLSISSCNYYNCLGEKITMKV